MQTETALPSQVYVWTVLAPRSKQSWQRKNEILNLYWPL